MAFIKANKTIFSERESPTLTNNQTVYQERLIYSKNVLVHRTFSTKQQQREHMWLFDKNHDL